MIKMIHYIVTRFNLGLYRTGGHDPDTWFRERVNLFSSITALSLANQSVQKFRLFILVDAETPHGHRELLNSTVDRIGGGFQRNIFPITLPGDWYPKRYGERWSCAIDYGPFLDVIRNDSKSILQTRLDNDDALLPDAVERIQNNCPARKESYCLDFLNGYAVDTIAKKAYYATHPCGTPFMSLYQPSSHKMKCVYSYTHQKMASKYSCEQMRDRIWIMNIHDKNVSNRLFDWLIQGNCNYKNLMEPYSIGGGA